MPRSRRLLLIGALIFIVGAAVTLFTIRSGGDDEPAPEPAATAAPETTEGGEQAGSEPITSMRIPQPLEVPDGMEGVAITVSFPQGVAAVPGPGDRVNVYGVFTSKPPAGVDDTSLPLVQRVLTDVEVLGRTGASIEAAGSPTYILALGAGAVQRTVLLSAAEQVWLTMTTEDAPAPSTGGGATHENVLP